MKKVVSILLSLVLLISLAPISVNAGNGDKPRYTVTFHQMGGSTPDESYLKYSKQVGKPVHHSYLINSHKEGYTCLGWSVRKNAKTPDIPIEEPIYSINHFYPPAGNMTLYPVWVRESDVDDSWEPPENMTSVTLDANGGENTSYKAGHFYLGKGDPAMTEDQFKSTQLAFKKQGHYLAGWSLNPNAEEADYDIGRPVYEETKLYAVWKPGCTISFYYGNVASHGGPSVLTVDRGQAYPAELFEDLPQEEPGSDYPRILIGWTEDENILNNPYFDPYEDDLEFISPEEVPETDKTLYPVWGPLFTIDFMMNDGTDSKITSLEYDYNPGIMKEDVEAVELGVQNERPGYLFQGWATSPDADSPNVPDDYTPAEGGDKIYAVWKEGYRITLNMGPEGFINSQNNENDYTIERGQPLTFLDEIDLPYHEFGQSFAGWTDTEGGSLPKFDSSYVPTGDLDLYPIWSESGHEIKVLNSPTYQDHIWRTSFLVQEGANLKNTLDRLAYTASNQFGIFLGWTQDPNSTEPDEIDPSLTINENITVYPVWKPTVQIRFMRYDPENKGDHIEYTIDDGAAVPEEYRSIRASSKNYDFLGWSTDYRASEADADFTQPIHSYNIMGDAHEFYAVWKPHDRQVQFDPNGGTGGPTSITVPHGSKMENYMPEEKPVRTGYTFKGWVTDTRHNVSSPELPHLFDASFNDNFEVRRDMTVYAKWSEDTSLGAPDLDPTPIYCVLFKNNGGKGGPIARAAREGKVMQGYDKEPTRYGYTFKGWATSSKASRPNFDPAKPLKKSHKVYAVWEKDTWDVAIYDMKPYKTQKMKTPKGVRRSKMTWKSMNTKKATVDSDGVVKAKYPGTVKIRAKVGSKKYYYYIRIAPRKVTNFKLFITKSGKVRIKGKRGSGASRIAIYKGYKKSGKYKFSRYKITKCKNRDFTRTYPIKRKTSYGFYIRGYSKLPTYSRNSDGFYEKTGKYKTFYSYKTKTKYVKRK